MTRRAWILAAALVSSPAWSEGPSPGAELDPPRRSEELIAQRLRAFEEHAQIAASSGLEGDWARALSAIADIHQASVAPTREAACSAGLAECLAAMRGQGALFVTEIPVASDTFTHFVADGAETRVVSGAFDGATLRLEAEVILADPRIAEAARRLAGPSVYAMERWVDSSFADGARFRSFWGGWLVDAAPLLPTDRVLCEGEGALTPARPRRTERVFEEAGDAERLWTRYAVEMPCERGFVFSAEIGARRGAPRRYPVEAEFAQDGGGLSRVRVFGAATVEERIPAGSHPPYGGECTFRHPGGEMVVRSPYGCSLTLAAELDGDGIPDFIVHTGSESCEQDTLWMSGPDGWYRAGAAGGCC